MGFMLLLLGIVLVAVICAAVGIITGWKQLTARPVTPRPMLPSNSIHRGPSSFTPKRELRSISIRECETLIHASDGVLFVSLDENGERKPLPFYNTYALVMTPRQFVAELQWFPSNTCVVLFGEVSLCSSVLGLLENVPEIPPIYMLRSNQTRWEVA